MRNFFSVPEAAKICSVNRATMLRWANSGKIKFYSTPGGHKRILKKDLKRWLVQNELPFDTENFPTNRAKILIVDDDESVRKYLIKLLKGVFVETAEAADGFEAGKKIIKFKPNLVILDLFMPNLDGFSLCQNIRNDSSLSKIKILILTGHSTSENKNKAISYGADCFLEKPSSKTRILNKVESLLSDKD